ARCDRDRLRVVARRERDDSARALFLGERRDLVVRAAELERAAPLEGLRLQVDRCADERVERARRDDRRLVGDTCEPLRCGTNVVELDQYARQYAALGFA